MAWGWSTKGKNKLKGRFGVVCLPLVATLLVCLGSIPLTPGGSWSPGAMEFHLCRLVSASVSMPGLLPCRIFKSLFFCLHSSHPSFPPAAMFWGGGVRQWDGASRRCALRCQNHTVHLGPGCCSFQCREIKRKKVNSYNLSAEGTLPSWGHGP